MTRGMSRTALIAIISILTLATFMLGRTSVTEPAAATATNAQLNALLAIHRDLLGIQKQLGGSTSGSVGKSIHDELVTICGRQNESDRIGC